jgi:hypothetical protein
VRFTGRLPAPAFQSHLFATDAVINLRGFAAPHMSAALLRALASGKPVLIPEIAHWAFLPASCCPRVASGTEEAVAASAAAILLEFAADGVRLAEASASARQWFLVHATVGHMADAYDAVLAPFAHVPDAATATA